MCVAAINRRARLAHLDGYSEPALTARRRITD
jgi:hypothetical protein